MTVKELIKELQKLDKNADVEIANASLTMDRRGELTWVGGGTRQVYYVKQVDREYAEGKKVIIS